METSVFSFTIFIYPAVQDGRHTKRNTHMIVEKLSSKIYVREEMS
jgi:hypothetical protein